jgi:hypothetical protein
MKTFIFVATITSILGSFAQADCNYSVISANSETQNLIAKKFKSLGCGVADASHSPNVYVTSWVKSDRKEGASNAIVQSNEPWVQSQANVTIFKKVENGFQVIGEYEGLAKSSGLFGFGKGGVRAAMRDALDKVSEIPSL